MRIKAAASGSNHVKSRLYFIGTKELRDDLGQKVVGELVGSERGWAFLVITSGPRTSLLFFKY